jgi:hypothetical protein
MNQFSTGNGTQGSGETLASQTALSCSLEQPLRKQPPQTASLLSNIGLSMPARLPNRYTARALLETADPRSAFLGLMNGSSPVFRQTLLDAAIVPGFLRHQLFSKLVGSDSVRFLPSTGQVRFDGPTCLLPELPAIPLMFLESDQRGRQEMRWIPLDSHLISTFAPGEPLQAQTKSLAAREFRQLGIASASQRFSQDFRSVLTEVVKYCTAVSEVRDQSEAVVSVSLPHPFDSYGSIALLLLVQPPPTLIFPALPIEERLRMLFIDGQRAVDLSLGHVRDPLHGVLALAEAFGFAASLIEPERYGRSRRVVIAPPDACREQTLMHGLIAYGSPAPGPKELSTDRERVLIQYARHFPEDLPQ